MVFEVNLCSKESIPTKRISTILNEDLNMSHEYNQGIRRQKAKFVWVKIVHFARTTLCYVERNVRAKVLYETN